ncbi:MAG: serine/threonine protein kinase [Polyangiaceae bacterium]|nr:serine/threonine protein kinase [Polyangiaceae bacterium]
MKAATVPAPPPRLELVERLGRGGMAEAWRARWRAGPAVEEVCVKRARPGASPAARAALFTEAGILARIHHPNVVGFRGVERSPEGEPLLVLDLVEGADLGRLIEAARGSGEPFAPGVVAHVARELCAALAGAQTGLPGGVVHRDVTPHNVLVAASGRLRLADFGLARAPSAALNAEPRRLAGKPRYLAPEQIRGCALDPRADLHAVGLLAYELSSCRRPFHDQSAAEALASLRAGRAPALIDSLRGIPPGLASALRALVDPAPARRPADAVAAARVLEPWADADAGRASLARAAATARARSSRPPHSYVGPAAPRARWTLEPYW